MKVGMVAQSLSRLNGGVSESVRLACASLAGHPDIEITCFAAQDEYLAEDFASFPPVRLLASRSHGTRRYGFAPAMVNQMMASEVDVMHVHGIWSYHARAAWVWHRRTGRPVVVTPHGMLEKWIVKRSRVLKALVWYGYLRRLMLAAACVQTLTDKELADVHAMAPCQRMQVIPNYVEAFVPDHTPPSWWRQDMAGKRIFLFLGRLHEKKGVIELCQAWRRFNADNPDEASASMLVLCGWNDGIEGLEKAVAQAAAPFDNALFAGPQYGEEKKRTLSAATFMILPSKSEGLPMSILEGWSAGLPTLMTPECNLPQGFEDGAAIRVDPETPSLQVGLLVAARLSDGEMAVMRDAARRIIATTNSSANIGGLLAQMYESAIGGQQALQR